MAGLLTEPPHIPTGRPNPGELGLAGEVLLNYEIGFGNLQRYAEESGLTPADAGDWVLVDDFWLVIPRTTEPGPSVLSIGEAPSVHPFAEPAGAEDLIAFAKLEVKEADPLLNWY